MALGSSSAAHHVLHQGVTSQGPLFTQASTQGWSGEISNKILWSSSHHCVTFVFLVSYFLFFLFLVSFFLVSNFYCHRDIIPSPNYCSQGAADVIVNLGSTTTSYCFTKIISSIIIFRIIINPQVDLVGIYQNRFCNQFFTALMFTSKHINVLLQ